MDVSFLLWDLVYFARHLPYGQVKDTRIYKVFESASFLNRIFYVDESKLINSSLVTVFPKGVIYNHTDSSFQFRDFHALLMGSTQMLRESLDLQNNSDALDKLERLEAAIAVFEKASLMDDITSHIAHLKIKK